MAGFEFVCEKQFRYINFHLPSGVLLEDQFFPAGASFKASGVLFGKDATVNAQVGQTIDLKASMDGLSLGPLSIKGASGPSPSRQVQISPTT
ncbi:hypothetical protein Asppvi_010106 [Aspergillus pseudoviridinutans]|uniref:Uncharacterized protein n=1 Tax=Aspergillus pseudoviridinutans TaxID=1517512 RepID=A0A9P3BH22_9EURO|nr:uncharacterized protein Asppvi_010106 [Aspergillus pseudoviridinutans]GIJ91141.1 hypothetical protein Asppvi_010106 [Aspergillus pseudoviridinutans]